MLDSLDNMTTPQLTRQEPMLTSDVTGDTTEDDVEHIDSEIGDISTADLFIIKSSFDSKSIDTVQNHLFSCRLLFDKLCIRSTAYYITYHAIFWVKGTPEVKSIYLLWECFSLYCPLRDEPGMEIIVDSLFPIFFFGREPFLDRIFI